QSKHPTPSLPDLIRQSRLRPTGRNMSSLDPKVTQEDDLNGFAAFEPNQLHSLQSETPSAAVTP
ncbi:MAG: hypothetical protein AAFP67_04175, partial [Pseudomonadota bacterium]